MSDSSKLISILVVIPVLIFSLYGFLATFEAVPFEESVTGWRTFQRVVCGGAMLGALGFMAWLAMPRLLPWWRPAG